MGRWTTEEINYLQENWGNIPLDKMVKKLKRTEKTIYAKAGKLNLGGYCDSGDMLTTAELIRALGYESSISWIRGRLMKHGLPVKEVTIMKSKVYKIKIDDFWKWAEKNKKIVNFARLEKGALGKEPLWVDEKRKLDLENPIKKSGYRPWTKEEDNLLVAKVKSYRYTYKDLAEEFKRTEASIKHRLYLLKVPYRPVQKERKSWTSEEKRKAIELSKAGYDNYAIAKELNKSYLSIHRMTNKVEV